MKVTIVSSIVVVAIIAGFVLKDDKRDDMNDFLAKELRELEDLIPYRDSLNEEVSQADVAWHLDHMLKVINRIHDALESSNQEDYSWSPHPLRLLVFNSGKMPRGRGKSPAVVLPPKVIETRDILDQLNEAKMKWKAIDQLPRRKWFDHYAFGQLDRDDAMRFIVIHTRHHLSIIRDILTTKPQS